MADPKTITEQIAIAKTLVITDKSCRYEALAVLGEGNAMILNLNSIFSKYRIPREKYISKYRMNSLDCLKYEYRPTLLSYDVYHTIELAPFILQINNMTSMTEFTHLENGLYLFNQNVKSFINEIIIREGNELKRNRTEINQELATY